jgi:hypothetical protein
MTDLAVYTTVYPGGESYWPSFLESLGAQTDLGFTLWVGVDGLEPSMVRELFEPRVPVHLRLAVESGSPSAIRSRALRQLIEEHEAVVLVDSDDTLMVDRVRAARSAIRDAGMVACALELMDESGSHLHRSFAAPIPEAAPEQLPWANVFGFTNTVWRSETLRHCLPETPDVELIDWHVATRAWLLGVSLRFDPRPYMFYRQHDLNMAGVLGPFSVDRMRVDIPRVLRHYESLLASDLSHAIEDRLCQVTDAHARLGDYWERAQSNGGMLHDHVASLDFEGRVPMWWEWVTTAVMSS